METIAILFKAEKLQETITENQVLIDNNKCNAKYQEGFSIQPDEMTNLLEQKYYDRARGCSVKAPENNIFDYDVYLN